MKYISFPEDVSIDYPCGCSYVFSKCGAELEAICLCEEHDPTIVGGLANVYDFEDDCEYATHKEFMEDEF